MELDEYDCPFLGLIVVYVRGETVCVGVLSDTNQKENCPRYNQNTTN
jgi:hypothetical protein